MEGGNAAIEPMGFACSMDSLSLLTTGHEPHDRLFTLSWATSAATALAAGMGARIQAAYPTFWPETVRALMVHSARWTPADAGKPSMHRQACATGSPCVSSCAIAATACRAWSARMYSARNSLTMIVQDQAAAVPQVDGSTVKTRDMHLHDLAVADRTRCEDAG